MPKILPPLLAEFVKRLFLANGVTPEDAAVVADHLVDANLAGHDSHGVLRVPQYLHALNAGQVQVRNRPVVMSQFTSGAVIDGQQCFGQVAAVQGMSLAIELAGKSGVSAVTVRNTYHTGRLGAYSEQATAAGMIGIVMVNAGGGGQSVAPFGGRERRLATNPISIAAPWNNGFPVTIDMATSIAPEGKIRLYKQLGKAVPAGWIIDGHGNPSTDPNDFYADPSGAILPLGSEAGYKGFGLALMVDLLAGALSGGGVCTEKKVPPTDSLLLIAIDIQRYSGAEQFQHHIEALANYIRQTTPAPGFERVYAPGELEHLARQHRGEFGIEIDDETWNSMALLASEAGVEFFH